MNRVYLVLLIAVVATGCRSPQDYLQRGKQCLEAGQYQEAALNFRKAIQKDSVLSEAHYQLGETLLRQGNRSEAYHSLLSANQLSPGNADTEVALADVALQLYDTDPRRPAAYYDLITKLTRKMETERPQAYDTLRFQGYVALLDRKPADAISYLQRANETKPFLPQTVMPLVEALIKDKRLPEAEKLGQDMIQHRKDFGPIYDVLYQAYLADGRPDQGETILKTKLANNPSTSQYGFQLALAYIRRHRNAEAASVVQSLVDRSSDFPGIYLKAGNFYASLGDLKEAERLFEEGAKRNPDDKLIYDKRLTAVMLAEGLRREALEKVEAILQAAPKDQEAKRLQALLSLDSHNPESFDRALAALSAEAKQNPNDLIVGLNLAGAYLRKGQTDQARTELSQILQQNPGFIPAHLLMAEIAVNQQQPRDILAHVTPVLEVEPGNPKARLFRVMGLMGQGESLQARQELDRLLKDHPNDSDARLELGFFDLGDKKYKEAEHAFRLVYQSGRNDLRTLQGLTMALTALGETDQALRILNEETTKSSQPTALRILLAKTAARVGKDDVAMDQLQQVVKDDTQSAEAHLLLAGLYERRGEYSQAEDLLKRASSLAPADPTPLVALASLQDRPGRQSSALASYRRALRLQPENPSLLNNLAFYIADNGGNLDEALSLAQRAVQKLKDDSGVSDTLGWIYLKKNMPDAALQIFITLVKKNPENPIFRYHLGAALAAKGDKAGARAALGAALTKKPEKQDELKIRQLLASLG